MANSAQARKRARQNANQRDVNMSLRSTLRTAIKKVRKAIEAGDKTSAQAEFKSSMSVIDSIADKKIVHKNKAARHKSQGFASFSCPTPDQFRAEVAWLGDWPEAQAGEAPPEAPGAGEEPHELTT